MITKRLMVLVGVIGTLAGLPAFASTSAANTNTVSPALVVNVTVQKAISLTLAAGTGCAVAPGHGLQHQFRNSRRVGDQCRVVRQ